jgi:hypothetical protein
VVIAAVGRRFDNNSDNSFRIGSPRQMRHEDSLLRPDVDSLDLISQQPEGHCDAELRLENGLKHLCTRPPGHKGQHYSFSGDPSYEIVWPATP